MDLDLGAKICLKKDFIRTHLKNRILVQDCGGAEFQTGGILLYVEDLKLGTNPAKRREAKSHF